MNGMAYVIKDNGNAGLVSVVQTSRSSVNDRFVEWPGRFEAESRRIPCDIMRFER
jgi:hypothetical protein